MRARLLVTLGLVAASALALTGGATAGNGGFSPVAPRSPNGDRIDAVYWFIFGCTAAIFVLVETALIVFILRFRSRGRIRAVEGPQIRGHVRLELAWTAVPVLILAAIATFTFYKLPGIKDVPEAGAAGGQIQAKVEGRQFYWEITYPNGVIDVNRLRAPVGQPVRLEVTAPESDVIHSWWVPELGGKLDAVPGRKNHTWFQAKRPGVWEAKCAEFCGIQHAAMLGTVEAMPASEFERWLSDERRAQTEGSSDLGARTFAGACANCHGAQGHGGIGPDIAGSGVIKDRKALGDIVEHGQNLMPAVGHGWPDRQTDALFAYLNKNIAPGSTGGG